jgi:hypothetical protein
MIENPGSEEEHVAIIHDVYSFLFDKPGILVFQVAPPSYRRGMLLTYSQHTKRK